MVNGIFLLPAKYFHDRHSGMVPDCLNSRADKSSCIQITSMVPSDLPAVIFIEEQSNVEPWSERSFLEELERTCSHLLLAKKWECGSELIVGFICFWLVSDEVQILNLAVHPSYRRKGIGRKLLHRCLSVGCLHQMRWAVLEVRSSNRAAQNLYHGFGFEIVGIRPDYYGKIREPAIIMKLDIQKAMGFNNT